MQGVNELNYSNYIICKTKVVWSIERFFRVFVGFKINKSLIKTVKRDCEKIINRKISINIHKMLEFIYNEFSEIFKPVFHYSNTSSRGPTVTKTKLIFDEQLWSCILYFQL